ncbi:MAG: hypothetical protein ACKVPX_09920 [Myxococcaceae bacterium]
MNEEPSPRQDEDLLGGQVTELKEEQLGLAVGRSAGRFKHFPRPETADQDAVELGSVERRSRHHRRNCSPAWESSRWNDGRWNASPSPTTPTANLSLLLPFFCVTVRALPFRLLSIKLALVLLSLLFLSIELALLLLSLLFLSAALALSFFSLPLLPLRLLTALLCPILCDDLRRRGASHDPQSCHGADDFGSA